MAVLTTIMEAQASNAPIIAARFVIAATSGFKTITDRGWQALEINAIAVKICFLDIAGKCALD